MEDQQELIHTVYIAIGVPGCGKSTWWNNASTEGLIPAQESICINMDTIREELTGSVSDQSKNGLVAKVAESNLKSAVAHKIPLIYWDNTTASPKYRKQVIKIAKESGYNAIGIFFDYPLDFIKKRNSSRERIVPEHVLDRMYNNIKLNPPRMEEGFDNIIILSIDE